MKINGAFIKSKEFIAWMAINVIFPIFIVGIYGLIDLSMLAKNITSGSATLIIFVVNVYFAKQCYKTPAFKYFIGIIILNILSLIFAGDISFITAIPTWPLFLESYYHWLISS